MKLLGKICPISSTFASDFVLILGSKGSVVSKVSGLSFDSSLKSSSLLRSGYRKNVVIIRENLFTFTIL